MELYFTCWHCGCVYDSKDIPFNPKAKDQSVKCQKCKVGLIVSPSGKVMAGSKPFPVVPPKLKPK